MINFLRVHIKCLGVDIIIAFIYHKSTQKGTFVMIHLIIHCFCIQSHMYKFKRWRYWDWQLKAWKCKHKHAIYLFVRCHHAAINCFFLFFLNFSGIWHSVFYSTLTTCVGNLLINLERNLADWEKHLNEPFLPSSHTLIKGIK